MKKVIMFQRSIANLDEDIVASFDYNCKIYNFSSWIRERAYEDFGLMMKHPEDVDELDKLVAQNFYKDKSEWLRDKMRMAIKNSQ